MRRTTSLPNWVSETQCFVNLLEQKTSTTQNRYTKSATRCKTSSCLPVLACYPRSPKPTKKLCEWLDPESQNRRRGLPPRRQQRHAPHHHGTAHCRHSSTPWRFRCGRTCSEAALALSRRSAPKSSAGRAKRPAPASVACAWASSAPCSTCWGHWRGWHSCTLPRPRPPARARPRPTDAGGGPTASCGLWTPLLN